MMEGRLYRILKSVVVALLTVLLVAFSAMSYAQCFIWRNDDALWSYQVIYNVENPIALNNLALTYEDGFRQDIFNTEVVALKEKVAHQSEYVDALRKRSAFGAVKEIGDIHNLAERRFVLLSKAVKGNDIICEPIVNLADLYASIGLPEIAIDYYEWALRVNWDYMKAHYDLAYLYADLGRDEESVQKYWQALHYKHMDSLQCGKVVSDLNEIIEKRRKNGDDASLFLRQREMLYVYLRDLALKKDFSAKDPYALAIAYENMQDWTAAAEAYKKAIKEKPQDFNRVLSLGNIYLQQKKFSLARDTFLRAAEIDAKNEKAYLNLGVAFDHLKQYDRSIENYNKVLALNKDHALAYCNMGHAYQNLNKEKEAIEAYTQAIKLKPDYDTAYYDMGNAWLKLKDVKRAEEAYRKALAINPRHMNALMNLSIVLFHQKKFQEAEKFCRKAQDLGLKPPKKYLQALKYYIGNPEAP